MAQLYYAFAVVLCLATQTLGTSIVAWPTLSQIQHHDAEPTGVVATSYPALGWAATAASCIETIEFEPWLSKTFVLDLLTSLEIANRKMPPADQVRANALFLNETLSKDSAANYLYLAVENIKLAKDSSSSVENFGSFYQNATNRGTVEQCFLHTLLVAEAISPDDWWKMYPNAFTKFQSREDLRRMVLLAKSMGTPEGCQFLKRIQQGNETGVDQWPFQFRLWMAMVGLPTSEEQRSFFELWERMREFPAIASFFADVLGWSSTTERVAFTTQWLQLVPPSVRAVWGVHVPSGNVTQAIEMLQWLETNGGNPSQESDGGVVVRPKVACAALTCMQYGCKYLPYAVQWANDPSAVSNFTLFEIVSMIRDSPNVIPDAMKMQQIALA